MSTPFDPSLLTAEDLTYIKAALQHSPASMLGLEHFVTASGFPGASLTVDTFFYSLKKQLPMYVSSQMLDYMGFAGQDYEKRNALNKNLKKNFQSGSEYWKCQNADYSALYEKLKMDYLLKNDTLTLEDIVDSESDGHGPLAMAKYECPEDDEKGKLENCLEVSTSQDSENNPDVTMASLGFPHPDSLQGGRADQMVHYVLTYDCLIDLLMSLNTEKAKVIKKCFKTALNLIQVYSGYQFHFERLRNLFLSREHSRVSSLLVEVSKKLDRTDAVIGGLNVQLGGLSEQLIKSEASNQRFSDQLARSEVANNALAVRVEEQTTEMAKVSRVLTRIAYNSIVPTISTATREMFVILDSGDDEWPYYAVRGQKSYVLRVLRKKAADVVFHLDYQPNACNLFNKIKENISYVQTKGNNIRITDGHDEAEFLDAVEELHQERLIEAAEREQQ